MPRTEAVRAIRPQLLTSEKGATVEPGDSDYVLPVLHVRMPKQLVDGSFWLSLGAAAVFGAIDAPLAVLIGAGVVIARHEAQRTQQPS